MKTIDAIKGRHNEVLSRFGLPEQITQRHLKEPCPICGKRDKFRYSEYNGNMGYICVCGSGSVIDLVAKINSMEWSQACREVDKILGNRADIKRTPKPQNDLAKRFEHKEGLKDTPAKQYLLSRGIKVLPQKDCKFSHSEMDEEEKRPFQAILTAMTTNSGRLAYMHKTYLEGGTKAAIESNKKIFTLGGVNKKSCPTCHTEFKEQVSAKIFPIAPTLGIAEGLETALSCKQIYNVNTWASLNSGHMKKFIAPQGVNHLIIFADNDKNGTGLAAAAECGNRNILHKNDVQKVTIRYPTEVCDFNDMLQTMSHVNEFNFSK